MLDRVCGDATTIADEGTFNNNEPLPMELLDSLTVHAKLK